MLITCTECGQPDEGGGAYCLNPSCGALLPIEAPARPAPPTAQPVDKPKTTEPARPAEATKPTDPRPGPGRLSSLLRRRPSWPNRTPGPGPRRPPAAATPTKRPAQSPGSHLRPANRLLLPAAAAGALVLAVAAVWLSGGRAAEGDADQPPSVDAASAPVPPTAPTEFTPAPLVTTSPTPSATRTPAPRPSTRTSPTKPPAQPKKPAPEKPAPPAPKLNMSTDVDCPDWGVHLTGSVANLGSRTISSVKVYHGQVGSTPAETFWLSQNGGTGSFTRGSIETWVPNYSGNPFRDGDRVYWKVTAYFAGGGSVVDDGTTSRSAAC